ncbi:unnamed protein product [Pieris brassicae]|uniref:Transcription factor CBF/NF-Y/archaeal histone domain-containing protein n=1 Tax=Pieris brassicae TaxID=7116 RepID=A0A9P0TXM1_PIEBR|nr:unnamed protein product [Pieris brassicae]
MPSKKRKYNARFPAGRIKKIMQTDEEVGKVAQAVPIIISRTLELFVESLLSKAMQVTMQRNAKTLSPSHVKQCILAESRFDFLRDLVKNVPDVTAAEEKDIQSGESSPNSSRFSDSLSKKLVRDDSNSSSSSDVKVTPLIPPRDFNQCLSVEADRPKIEAIPEAIDLTKKDSKPIVTAANFYQETLPDEVPHKSVIQLNPTYASPQPSTSSYAILKSVDVKTEAVIPQQDSFLIRQATPPLTPITPITPIFNIDFTKNLAKPEIKVLDANAVKDKKMIRQNSKSKVKKIEIPKPVILDNITTDLQIDEDYDT